jgi:hypothetical protein
VSGDDQSQVVQSNARSEARQVSESSQLLAEVVAKGCLNVQSSFFEQNSGLIKLL